ncbi:hypothetical protein CO670_15305 [Rhizobium sp. J15]|uniref:hypothetical protein n=1 Tax=Rhizobium sp. J15 TaxID=2035450 RepID=UPI000BE9223C|nr:hypothetical protein [Rhizobium sp. J15]PDT15862.1 hypothetical protein CO670_15305 [Rhizobium sp. J15]
MSEDQDITVVVCVRNGCVEGLAVEGSFDVFREWMEDPNTEMLARVPLSIGRELLFKSRGALFDEIEGMLA